MGGRKSQEVATWQHLPSFLALIAVLGLLSLSSCEALAVPTGGPPCSNPGVTHVQIPKPVEQLSNPPGASLAVVIAPEPNTGVLLLTELLGLLLMPAFRRRHKRTQSP